MPVWAVRKEYLLIEAFELVGERLFGPQWDGNEAMATPVLSVAEHAARRAALAKQIAELRRQRRSGSTRKPGVSKPARPQSKAKREKIAATITTLAQRLQLMPEDYRPDATALARYERRQATLDTLRLALVNGRIGARTLEMGYVIPGVLWETTHRTWFHLHYGLIRLPGFQGRQRVQSVRIEERAFDRWLDTLPRTNGAEPQHFTAEELCKRWLRRMADTGDAANKTRAEVFKEASRLIEDLPYRTFLRQWDRVMPEAFHKPGRKPIAK